MNRIAYDLKLPLTDFALARFGEPQCGEVLTFTSPADRARLMKRLVALPGEVVEMQDEVLVINGQAAEYGHPEHTGERFRQVSKKPHRGRIPPERTSTGSRT